MADTTDETINPDPDAGQPLTAEGEDATTDALTDAHPDSADD